MTASKRGLCWPSDNKDPVFTFTRPGSKISWLYNWSPNQTAGCSLDWTPMQWNAAAIEDLGNKVKEGNAHAILGFNEPERGDQANLTPEAAAAAWVAHVEPLRRSGVRAGSPGCSSAPEGLAWLQKFLQLIRQGGSDIDFYAFHWYGETLGQFYDYIWSTYHQLGPDRPVWITEYAPTNWQKDAPLGSEHVEAFVRDSCKYLDTLDWVERYAFFGPMRDTGTVGKSAAFLDENGQLTETGKIYVNS